ncbi:MAG: hypothetical protein F9K22_14870, partial [Bacteroidetes bacterium]
MRALVPLFLVIALLLSFAPAASAQLTVSGADLDDINGVYEQTDVYLGRPFYTRTTGDQRLIFWSSPHWRITNGTGTVYFQNNADIDLPPDSGWTAGIIGTGTAPTLAPAAIAPAGSGTSEDPYLIASLANLVWIAATDAQVPSPNRTARWAAQYVQTADIDATETGYGGYWDAGWFPIGYWGNPFTGLYEGDSHTINGLFVSGKSDYSGLFGYVNSSLGLWHLGLTNVNIDGYYETGALAGEVRGSGGVNYCYSTGTVDGYNYLGGLVGFLYNSTMNDSYSSATVTGAVNYYSGGLVGFVDNSTVDDCYASGAVNGYYGTGGLAGALKSNGVIVRSYSTGMVTGTSAHTGGLVGDLNNATVEKSYSRGTVNAGDNGGGLVGYAYNTTITDSYSLSNVSAGEEAGGLAAYLESSSIIRCYSAGSVSGTTDGGLVGYQYNLTVNNCFWDTQTSGQATSAGGTGKTTAEMKTQSTFTDASWDFVSTWDMVPGNYPQLVENPDGALPVELTSFTAVAKGRGVELAWKTATELNNKGFEIQRTELNHRNIGSLNQSTDGSMNQWHGIGFIAGHGTTNAPQSYSFVDNNTSGAVLYRLKQVNNDGSFTYSSAVEVTVAAPVQYSLNQNHPNPFNPATTISYSLPAAGFVSLKVYDILGKEVAVLVHETQNAG